MSGKKNGKKNFNLKAALIVFGIVGIAVVGLIGGFSGHSLIPALLAGTAAGAVGGVMFSPLDTTTHNRQDRERQQAEMSRQIPLTGDPIADPMIDSGLRLVEQIEENLKLLTDEDELSASVATFDEKTRQILRSVSETPEKASRIRKFIHYYLPTATKLLNNYCVMKQRGITGDELQKAGSAAMEGYSMINTVCEKQLELLHSDNMMDMDTDLDVLETMLVRDGYTKPLQDAISEEVSTYSAVTAAEEQFRNGGVPVIQFPPDEEIPLSSDTVSGNTISNEKN